MDTLQQAAHKLIRKISGFLYTDAPSRQLGELMQRIDRGEVVSKEEARVVVCTLMELDYLRKRVRDRIERIHAEAAKMPPEAHAAYQDELARGRR